MNDQSLDLCACTADRFDRYRKAGEKEALRQKLSIPLALSWNLRARWPRATPTEKQKAIRS